MTRTEITEGIAEILEECAGVNPADVTEDKTFAEDLDVDSLSMVEICVAAEEKFDIHLDDHAWLNITTVGDAVTLIDNTITAKALSA